MQFEKLRGYREPTDLVKNQVHFAGRESRLSIYNTYVPANGISLGSDHLLFCSMLSGRKVINDGVDTKKRVISSGEAFFITPGSKVYIDCPDAKMDLPTSCLAIEISRDNVNKILEDVYDSILTGGDITICQGNSVIEPFDQNFETRQLLERLVFLFTENHPDRDLLIDLSIKELIVRLLRNKGREFIIARAQSTPDANGLIAVLKYIRDNAEGQISIDSLTKSACMSRSRLYSEFKKQLGCTPFAFHQELRLKEAARRLSNGEKITTVSYDLGFSCPSHFSHRFRDLFGCSPRAFKSKMLAEPRPNSPDR